MTMLNVKPKRTRSGVCYPSMSYDILLIPPLRLSQSKSAGISCLAFHENLYQYENDFTKQRSIDSLSSSRTISISFRPLERRLSPHINHPAIVVVAAQHIIIAYRHCYRKRNTLTGCGLGAISIDGVFPRNNSPTLRWYTHTFCQPSIFLMRQQNLCNNLERSVRDSDAAAAHACQRIKLGARSLLHSFA